MHELPLGPCFRAPRHDRATCPHEDGWRFSWIVKEPTFRTRGGRRQVGEQAVQFVVCMACDALLVNGAVVQRPREWATLPDVPSDAAGAFESGDGEGGGL